MKRVIPANDRESWLKYYIERFNKHGFETSAHMAMFYQLLILAEGNHTYPVPR